ncbi:MAG: PilZ domain-containing protein [Acidobacteriota bacterium]
MAILSKVSQDQRFSSRVIAQLDCRMEYNNSVYDAVIVDLSQKGALVMAPSIPPTDENIKIIINSKHLQKELILTGTVLRSTEVMTEQGKRRRFALSFHESPLDLIILIGKLSIS